jgi:3-oxoacyl-[acyl-carrier-protein] synthase-1
MKSNVVISAVGMLNALGDDLESIRDGLFRGDQSGIRKSDRFIPGVSCYVGGVVSALPECPNGLERLWSRNAALSLAALRQIEPTVRSAIDRFGKDRIGVVMGSSTSGIDEGEEALRVRAERGDLPANYSYSKQIMGSVSEVLACLLGTTGPSYTISTACSSSAKVFRAARGLIDSGCCDCVLIGGFDSLCKLTLNGFSALELVSDEITNPFSKNRKGITIGEGGAIFLVERCGDDELLEDTISIVGVGESSDAYHISSPDPSAAGAISAIGAALRQAGASPPEIDYVNLHGTGTLHNDAMEARAIREVFSSETPCSSTKPLVGHALGASGAIEAAFCWMVLQDPNYRLPPHCFDGQQDPKLPSLNLVNRGAVLAGQPRYALSNSFGVGGSNCAVVLKRGR